MNIWLVLLIAVHVVLGFAFGRISKDEPWNVPLIVFIGLVFSQACLLSIWAAWGSWSTFRRWTLVLLMVSVLAMECHLASEIWK